MTNPPPQSLKLALHPRVQDLSHYARVMYLNLASHASPDGDVVTLRVDHWLSAYPEAYGELVARGLLVVEDDLYHVVMPEHGEVP